VRQGHAPLVRDPLLQGLELRPSRLQLRVRLDLLLLVQ
jgi:hypothetical protein